MSFKKVPHSKIWRLEIKTGVMKCPFIVGCGTADGEHTKTLFEKALICPDDLDGSSHDSDGCERYFSIETDREAGVVVIETLEKDERFWVGSEHLMRIGGLGYCAEMFEENIGGCDLEIQAYFDEDHDELDDAFVWSASFVRQHYPMLATDKTPAGRGPVGPG